MTSLACRRLRPALVDLAEGALAVGELHALERHLQSCQTCREDLAAMRGVSTVLRDPGLPEPDEDFWVRQRESIMQRVRASAPRVRGARRRWPVIGALVAAALSLVVTRTLYVPARLPHSVERLDDDTLFDLHDLLPSIAPASSIEDADGGDLLSLQDLGDDDLDSLAALLDNSS